jgi:DNA-binding LacI/PurR family transcriptional regulator
VLESTKELCIISQENRRRPRLKDVAELAGVSVQTVSNVVNSRDFLMTPETQQRVREAMQALGYHPNSQARGLRSRKLYTLAFLLLDDDPRYLSDPMTDLIISGVGAVARDRGYMVLVHAAGSEQFDYGLLDPLQQNRADGALLMLSGPPSLRSRYLHEVQQLTPNFVIFEDVDNPAVTSVTANNRQGALDMTRRLIDAGHRRIAFIGSAISWPMIEQRLDGYKSALAQAGIAFDPALTRFEGEWHAATGAQLVAQLCEEADPPTALLAGNDLLAAGAIKALKERGLRIPEDFAVAGFNNFEFSEYTDPPLTTLQVPGFEIGSLAATKLIDRIEGKDEEATATVLPVEIVPRGSA